MDQQQTYRIDGVLWWVWQDNTNVRHVQPICPHHKLRMYPARHSHMNYDFQAVRLKCEECAEFYNLSRNYSKEEIYVLDKIDAKIFKGMKVFNIDDEAVPLTEEKLKSVDSKYFVTSLLTKSKTGLRLVVYAGKKGSGSKTQIFVEPEIKRLSFDQKDLHPTEVFTKLEATFSDGTKASQGKK